MQHVAVESCALFHQDLCLIAAENVCAKLVLDLVVDVAPEAIVKVDTAGKSIEEVIDWVEAEIDDAHGAFTHFAANLVFAQGLYWSL